MASGSTTRPFRCADEDGSGPATGGRHPIFRARVGQIARDPKAMITASVFRVVSYSAHTSHVTVHVEQAILLHKYLEDAGIRVDPLSEAVGTIFCGFMDENGQPQTDTEPLSMTFIADATPAILQPLLQKWFAQSANPIAASAETPDSSAAAPPPVTTQNAVPLGQLS